MGLNAVLEMLHPPTLRVGSGQVRSLSEYMASQARASRVFVLSDPVNAARLDALGLGEVAVFADVRGEPDTNVLDAALDAVRTVQPDVVVGFGGGSVMDLAKLVAVLARSALRLNDVSGLNRTPKREVGLVQIPTTAGTGSEAGTRALITDPQTLSKVAVESSHMLADLVILDPDLTISLPAEITAAVGVDAMAHCVEAFTSRRSHPVIDAYALEGISLIGRYLARAVAQPNDIQARAGMQLAAFYGGICLGPVNTTAGHAIAYPLGTTYKIAHGLANALVFPYVLAFNAPAVPQKTQQICDALGLASGEPQKVEREAVAFCRDIGIRQGLADFGIPHEQLASMAREAYGIRRLLDHNPRVISQDQIKAIYEAAY